MNGVSVYATSLQVGFCIVAAMPTISIMWCDGAYLLPRYSVMVVDGSSFTLKRSKLGVLPKCNKSAQKCKTVQNGVKKYKVRATK